MVQPPLRQISCSPSFLLVLISPPACWDLLGLSFYYLLLGAEAPPLAKVMRKEAPHTQRQDRVPLEFLKHLPPKPESAYFLLCAVTYTSDFTGGCPPLPLSEKRVNLQLQLIKFLGVILFQPTNSFGSPLACLNRFFRPHVIAQSLPTVRGMRCSKLPKHRFL